MIDSLAGERRKKPVRGELVEDSVRGELVEPRLSRENRR